MFTPTLACETEQVAPQDADCGTVALHVAEVRVAARAEKAPERDREAHRRALSQSVIPAVEAACELATEDARSCALQAKTAEALAHCGDFGGVGGPTRRAPTRTDGFTELNAPAPPPLSVPPGHNPIALEARQ